MTVKSEEESDNIILYDINTYTHPNWNSEINLNKELNAYAKYQKSQANPYNYLFKLTTWIKNKFNFGSNQSALKFLFTSSKPWNQWKLAVSQSGCFCLLRENFIEFYENLESIVWRIGIRTKFVKICNIFLNELADMVVYTDEFGSIYFFDVRDGIELFRYNETKYIEYENAICKVFFMNKDTLNVSHIGNDILEIMMTLTYSGYFNVYVINRNKTINKIYGQTLLNKIPHGIYCAEIDSKFEYLIIGSFASNTAKKDVSPHGISIWRILNTEPWLKHVSILSDNESAKNQKGDSKKFSKLNFSKIEYVNKLDFSPDNLSIAAIYISGKISIFSMPTLKLVQEWFMTEQPNYNETNSEIVENPYELKKFKQIYHEADYRVVDIGWWNKKVLLLTRGTGLLSLVSVDDLTNLMGRNQQWLNPFPLIYSYLENEFILLDCACVLASMNSSSFNLGNLSNASRNTDDMNSSRPSISDSVNEMNMSNDEETNVYEEDEDDEDDDSWFTYIKNGVRSQAYNLVGLERFKLPPKKIKVLKRKFSLLHIKSTTPAELFERKLSLEEYGEALALAKAYNLDTDLVYQKQWRTKPISKSTILDYLSKIKKRSWILHECEERVSPNIDTTKFLIDFGLHGTDMDSLIAINEHDNNKFVYSYTEIIDDDEEDIAYDKFNPETMKQLKRKQEQLRVEKLKEIDSNNLNLMQKQLLLTRSKLLYYMDCLNVYEEILGGPQKAAELFDSEKYVEIRSKSILDVTLDYAREGNSNAVEILLSYYYKNLDPHYLEILDNFPETMDPEQYTKLLPRIENEDVVLYNETYEIRNQKDWIELPDFQRVLDGLKSKTSIGEQNTSNSINDLIYTTERIETWYSSRIVEIENLTDLVDITLKFAELAIANGCRNLINLAEDLRTLFTLIYECSKQNNAKKCTNYYNLEFIKRLSRLDRLCLIMSHSYESTNELFVKNLKEWMLPYISRCSTLQERKSLLHDYLIRSSKDDLNICFKLFKLKISNTPLTILNELNLISTVLDCFYENEVPQQVEICAQIVHEIVNTLEPNRIGPLNMEILEKIKQIQDFLKACEIFKKYGVLKPLVYFRESCESADNCRNALVKLTWFASKRSSHVKLSEWVDLMKDLRYLQSNIYRSLVNYQECTEIFLSSLLNSRNLENIRLGSDWLKDIFAVDKQSAVQIAIKAAQEYFNACSNYFDSDMDLAKACLNLIQTLLVDSKQHPELSKQIAYEYDLMDAMRLIADEFDFSILPVQVRLSQEVSRFEIIKDILKKKEASYKSYGKLIELAEYLHLSDKNQVLLLIAEYSLEKNNLMILKEMCNRLMRENYGQTWKCVHKLAFHLCVSIAEQQKIAGDWFNDTNSADVFLSLSRHQFNTSSGLLSSREKTIKQLCEIENLLAFCLTNCDINRIQYILYEKLNVEKARVDLEMELIDINDLISNQQDISLNLESARSTFFSNNERYESSELKTNTNTLYLLLKNVQKNLKIKNRAELIQLLNYLCKIELNLAFAYLLELSDSDLVFLLDDLQCGAFTNKSFEFMLYLISLNLIRSKMDQDKESILEEHKSFLYDVDLNALASFLEQDVDLESDEDSISELFRKLNRSYIEYNQNSELDRLDMGIDLKRFDTDQKYKHETILGLSMDLKTFSLACSLAKFYEFDLWTVYMSFTEYLFTDEANADLELTRIEELIRPLMPVLKQKRDEYESAMFKSVFSYIDGSDLEKMSLFYKLLENDKSDVHLRIIKKLKSINCGDSKVINYKNLLNEPYETIEPYLGIDDEANLQIFTKLLPKLPVANNERGELKPSKLYVVWCLKKFWSKLDECVEKEERSENEMKNAINDNFESLTDNIKKLETGTDFVYFVKELTLSRKCCEKLSVAIRRDLLKRINRLVKQQEKQQPQKSSSGVSGALQEVLSGIQSHLKVVESIQSLFSNQAKNSKLEKNQRYIEIIDKELGSIISCEKSTSAENDLKNRKLEATFVELLFDGYTIEFISELINLLRLNESRQSFSDKENSDENSSNISIKKLLKLCLHKLSTTLIEEKKNPENKIDCLSKLNKLLETISSYLTKIAHGGKEQNCLLNDEDVMQCMRTFCNDAAVDINIRLFILEELKKIIKSMSDTDLMLLLVYKTNAIFLNASYFSGNVEGPIESEQIDSEKKRRDYMSNLIELSQTKSEYLALLNLIKVWPMFTNLETPDDNPLNAILIKLVMKNEQFVDLIENFKLNNLSSSVLAVEDLEYIKSQVEASKKDDKLQVKISLLKLCIIFKSKDNEKFIKNFMKLDPDFNRLTDRTKNELYEELELMNLLEKENFYLEIVNTNFYAWFTDNLIRNEVNKIKLHSIVRSLKSNGFEMEAAMFYTDIENFFNSYKSLSISMSLLDKF